MTIEVMTGTITTCEAQELESKMNINCVICPCYFLQATMAKFLQKVPVSVSISGLPPKSNQLIPGLCPTVP